MLPGRPLTQYWAKLSVSVIGAAMLGIALVFSAWIVARLMPAEASNNFLESLRLESSAGAYLTSAIVAFQILAWGMFCSLLSTRVVPTLIWTTVLVGATDAAIVIAFSNGSRDDARYQFLFAIFGIGIPLAVLFINVVLVRYWYRESNLLSGLTTSWRHFRTAVNSREPVLAKFPAYRSAFQRLMWQQTRESWGLAAGLTAVAWVCLGFVVQPLRNQTDFRTMVWQCVAMFASLCGASVFRSDHSKGSVRFFSDRGTPPGLIWWSRQLFWFSALGLLLVVAILFTLASPLVSSASTVVIGARINHFSNSQFILLAVGCYSIGQYSSLLIRNPLIAWSAAVLGAILFGLVWLLMAFLNVPLILVAAVPLILFVVSRLEMVAWLREERTWKHGLRHAAGLFLPAIALFATFAAYRAFEIPYVQSETDRLDEMMPVTEDTSVSTMADRVELADVQEKIGAKQLDEAFSKLETIWKRVSPTPGGPYFEPTLLEALRKWAEAPGQTDERLLRAAKNVVRTAGSSAGDYCCGSLPPSPSRLCISFLSCR